MCPNSALICCSTALHSPQLYTYVDKVPSNPITVCSLCLCRILAPCKHALCPCRRLQMCPVTPTPAAATTTMQQRSLPGLLLLRSPIRRLIGRSRSTQLLTAVWAKTTCTTTARSALDAQLARNDAHRRHCAALTFVCQTSPAMVHLCFWPSLCAAFTNICG